MNQFFRPAFRLAGRLAHAASVAAALSLALGACSVLETDRIDYKSAGKAPSLEIPPDLQQLSRENRYNVPGGVVTASGYQVGTASQSSVPTASATLGDVRIERAGNQRWLVVNRPADQLWNSVKDFWQESGFLLAMDQTNLGIMETDWAENRAKLPQDFFRNSAGKLFDALYSTGERDKFRTRLERTANGNMFISLEDETGISNAFVPSKTFEANRLVITQENFLIIEGKLQKSQGVISVLARKFEALPSALHDRNLSHDFH